MRNFWDNTRANEECKSLFMSGTPWSQSPGELEGIIGVLVTVDWVEDARLKYACDAPFQELVTSYERLLQREDQVETNLQLQQEMKKTTNILAGILERIMFKRILAERKELRRRRNQRLHIRVIEAIRDTAIDIHYWKASFVLVNLDERRRWNDLTLIEARNHPIVEAPVEIWSIVITLFYNERSLESRDQRYVGELRLQSHVIPGSGRRNKSRNACISAGRCISGLIPACRVDSRTFAAMASSLALCPTQCVVQHM